MKFCSECGAVITEDAEFCEECGTALRAVPSTTFTPELFARVRTSGKAIFSLVLGIGCFFLLAISFFMGILSLFSGVSGLTTGKFFLAWFMAAITCVVLGHMAQSEIQSSRMGDARLQGAGVAVAGLILGYLQLGLVVLAIVFAVAIPNLMRSKTAANEASAVGSLRTLNAACMTFEATYGRGYPASLLALGNARDGKVSPAAANLIDGALATGIKSGYRFVYAPQSLDGYGFPHGYGITAEPLEPGNSGQRYFYMDQSGVIRSSTGGPAGPASPPLQ